MSRCLTADPVTGTRCALVSDHGGAHAYSLAGRSGSCALDALCILATGHAGACLGRAPTKATAAPDRATKDRLDESYLDGWFAGVRDALVVVKNAPPVSNEFARDVYIDAIEHLLDVVKPTVAENDVLTRALAKTVDQIMTCLSQLTTRVSDVECILPQRANMACKRLDVIEALNLTASGVTDLSIRLGQLEARASRQQTEIGTNTEKVRHLGELILALAPRGVPIDDRAVVVDVVRMVDSANASAKNASDVVQAAVGKGLVVDSLTSAKKDDT